MAALSYPATENGHAIISSIPGEEDSNNHTPGTTTVELPGYNAAPRGARWMLVRYAFSQKDYYKYDILGVTVVCSMTQTGGVDSYYISKVGSLRKAFDPTTVTYREYGTPNGYYDNISLGYGATSATATLSFAAGTAFDILKNGLMLEPGHGLSMSIPSSVRFAIGDKAKKIVDTIYVNGRGWAPSYDSPPYAAQRSQPNLFRISGKNSTNYSLESPQISNVKFRYRAKGTTDYQEVDLGTELEYELAGILLLAETTSSGTMEIQFAITDTFGGSDTTPWKDVSVTPGVFVSTSPGSGAFVNRVKDALFSCSVAAGVTLKKFRYRKQGEESYTEVDADNANKRYVLPANTITDGGTYEYSWTATDRYDASWQYGWFSVSTIDAVSTAVPVHPVGSSIDSDHVSVFSWQHSISTGSPQTRADLQKSSDGETWTDLVTVTGAETSVSIPAHTFSSGTWYWRVRTFNSDNVASAWSAATQFLSIASPTTPIITVVDSSPRPTVTWGTNEQEAWELSVDGESTTQYGSDKTWTSPKYLTDGEHIVRVRAQNQYGLWSAWGETTLTITNTPGGSIQLTAQGEGAAVRLTWNVGGYDYYLVYRDDVTIARVTETEYLDYLSCGLCTYKVRGCYASSNNYGISDPVIVEGYPRCPVIIDVETRAALWLELSEQQHRTYSMTRARQATSYHIVGQARPSVDVSEFLDETLTVSAAFWADDRAGMRQLEAFLGRVVCLKTDSGEMAIGVLTSTTKTVDMFYTSYQLAVTNTELEEEVRE
mgnify:CR=1 FL=1